MDIERTMQFILENDARLQAKLDAHVDTSQADIAQLKARTEADIAQLKARTEQHDREMAEIREILRETTKIQQEQGRILVRIESNNDKLAVAQAELAAAQKATEATLKAFIDSLQRGGNGHSNGGGSES